MSPRRLTVGRIKRLCTRRAFEHGREYCGDDRVVAVGVSDGVVSGEILAEEDIRVTASLRTGSRSCACRYSRIGVCGHAAAVLLYAAKKAGATIPGDDDWAAVGGPPREGAAPAGPAEDPPGGGSEEMLETAGECEWEGDYPAAAAAYAKAAEMEMGEMDAPGGQATYSSVAFRFAVDKLEQCIARQRLDHRMKRPHIAYLHGMFLRNSPGFATRAYGSAAIAIYNNPEDYRCIRRLHEPILPEPGAAPSDRNAVMLYMQEMIL